MITITISGVEHEIEYTKLDVNSIQSGVTELKSPKTGHRKWVGGSYLILNFLVNIFKEDDPEAKFRELTGYIGNICYLSVDNTSYLTTHRDIEPIEFYILSCTPYYMFNITTYDICYFSLSARIRTEEQYQYLIDDLEQFILTDGDKKIIISQ